MNARDPMSKYLPAIVTGLVAALLSGGLMAFMLSSAGAETGLFPAWVGGFVGVFTAYIMANLAGTRLGDAGVRAALSGHRRACPGPGTGASGAGIA